MSFTAHKNVKNPLFCCFNPAPKKRDFSLIYDKNESPRRISKHEKVELVSEETRA